MRLKDDDDEQATERPGGLLAESSRATAGVKKARLIHLIFPLHAILHKKHKSLCRSIL